MNPRFRPHQIVFASLAAVAATTPALAQTNLTANSLADLRSFAAMDNVNVTLAAGEYWLEGDGSNPNFLDFSGSNSTFDLSAGQIKLDTRDLAGYGNSQGIRPITVTGSSNLIQGLDFSGHDIDLDTDPNARRHADRSAVYLQVTGSNNRIQDATLLVRGSSPYGYGDVFGKGARFPESGLPVEDGGFAFLSHQKTSSFLVTGDARNTVVDNLDLTSQAYGHGFFVQGDATNTTIRNSTLTGQLISGNDAIAHPEYQEYAAGADGVLGTSDDGGTRSGTPLPENIFLSAQEDGIRSYTGSGSLTVQNTTVTNFRSGVHSTFANGTVIIDNVDVRGTENAFIPGSNTTITNSTADIVNGPAVYVQYNDDRNTTIDIEIVGEVPEGVDWAVAYLNGDNFDVTIRSDLPAGFLPEDSLVRFGQTWFNNWRDQLRPTGPETASPGAFTNSTFTNLTNEYVVLGNLATGNDGFSQSGVVTNGKENDYDGISVVLPGTRVVVTDRAGLGNNGTQSNGSLDANASIVFDGATLEIEAGRRVDDEKLTITGDGVDGRGALFSRGSNDFSTRFGDSTAGNESTVFLDGDASIGVGTADRRLIVGAIQGVGDLTKKGAGILLIGKASTYDGNLTVEQGHVATRSGVVHNDLSVAAGASLGQISNNGLNTDGDITLAGTLDLNGRSDANTLTGRIGRLDGAGRITSSNATSGAGARLTLDGDGADGNFSGRIDGAVSLIKSGTNAQTLSGTLTHTGTTVVNDGVLLINGIHTGGGGYTVNNGGTLGGSGAIQSDVGIANGATLAAGAQGLSSRGTLSLGGDLALAAGSTLAAELSTPTDYDGVTVSGQTTVAGDLALQGSNALANYTPAILLSSGGGITGTFTNIDGVVMADNTGLAVTYTANTVNVTRARLGDLNLDGDVDVSDFIFGNNGGSQQGDLLVLASNLGTTNGATWSTGDLNGDGDVDVTEFVFGVNQQRGDLFQLAANLGSSSAASAAVSVASAPFGFAEEADTDFNALGTGQATVAYDAATGELILDLGEGVIAAAIVSELDLLDITALDTSTTLGEASQTQADALAFSDPAGLASGSFRLGNLLDAGLSLGDLGNFGVSFAGAGTDGFARVTVVPEPATLAMLAAGGLSLLTRRRRGA